MMFVISNVVNILDIYIEFQDFFLPFGIVIVLKIPNDKK